MKIKSFISFLYLLTGLECAALAPLWIAMAIAKTIVFSLIAMVCVCVLVARLCPTLCDPMDCSPPGSSVLEILQARILEWVASSCSRGSSRPRLEPGSPALQADALPSELLWKQRFSKSSQTHPQLFNSPDNGQQCMYIQDELKERGPLISGTTLLLPQIN